MKGLFKFRAAILTVIIAALTVAPALAQQAAEPDAKSLLKQIQELQQKLAAQQEQNQALQEQLTQLQQAVSALTETQQAQAQEIEKIPEKVVESAPVKPAGKEKIFIKGFISATLFSQDQNFAFGNGQNAEFPVGEEFTENKWFAGGDVRNTRLDIGANGPDLKKWTSGGLVEVDFFGGFNGTGAFSHQQPQLRLRLAYIELQKPGTKIRIGQDWSPLFGEWPISESHIAFPLGYGSAGDVGWRFPGVYLWQDLGESKSGVTTQLNVGVFEGSWSGPGNNVDFGTAGNVGFNPQVEARLNVTGDGWKVYAVGHWDQKDLKGANNIEPNPPIDDSITGTAAEVGFSITPGHWLIHGNGYYGTGVGQQLGAITQFGDITSYGAWLQLGYNFTERWSLYGFAGFEDPDDDDVVTWVGPNGRTKNQMYNLNLRYALGPYWFGLEWLHDTLNIGTEGESLSGNQIAASWLYKF